MYVHHYQEKLANRRRILMALVERSLIGENRLLLLFLSLAMLEEDRREEEEE